MFQKNLKVLLVGLVSAASIVGGVRADEPYVFFVVIDGIRNEEAYETSPTPFAYMPTLQQWYNGGEAAFYAEFYNDSRATWTTPSHETMVTGQWHLVPNLKGPRGFSDSRPETPTIFECLRKQMPSEECYAVVGKDMCKQLNWSLHPSYGPQYATVLHSFPDLLPGPWDMAFGSDDDVCDKLWNDIQYKIQQGHTIPKFVFVHLGDVDASGHRDSYYDPGGYPPTNSYLEFITRADYMVDFIWNQIIDNADWPYKDNTVMIVTSDHGRNYFPASPYPGWGYSDHGGMSHQNRHILFVARGPGIQNGVYSETRFHIDIVPTVAKLLGLDLTPVGADTKYARGQVMEEMFVNPPVDPRIYRHQKNPRIAAFGGNVAYVWSENDPALNDTGNEAVFARFKRSGLPWSGEIQISPVFDDPGDPGQSRWAYYPDIAANNDGCHIVWLDSRIIDGPIPGQQKGNPVPEPKACWSIYYRGSFDWQTLKDEKLIAHSIWETEDPNELVILGDPEIVCNHDGELIITARCPMAPEQRYINCFRSSDGFNTWTNKKITDPNLYKECVSPREYTGTLLAAQTNIGVVWQDLKLKPGSTTNLSWDIFFTRTVDSGENWDYPTAICNDEDYSMAPKVAYNGTIPRILVVWSSRVVDGLAPCEIKSSTKDGSSWSSSTAIVQNAWAPDLIWNSGAGKFYLVWEEYPIGGGDPDLKYSTSSDGIT